MIWCPEVVEQLDFFCPESVLSLHFVRAFRELLKQGLKFQCFHILDPGSHSANCIGILRSVLAYPLLWLRQQYKIDVPSIEHWPSLTYKNWISSLVAGWCLKYNTSDESSLLSWLERLRDSLLYRHPPATAQDKSKAKVKFTGCEEDLYYCWSPNISSKCRNKDEY